MSTLAKLVQGNARKPPGLVVLKPEHFKSTFTRRPEKDVAVGLRRISEADYATGMAEASKTAWELHDRPEDEENRIHAQNGALIREAIAMASCDVNDVDRPFKLFESLEYSVREALTPEGCTVVFDKLTDLHDEMSPAEASDDELIECAFLLTAGTVEKLAESQQPSLRRRAYRLLSELRMIAEVAG